MATSKKSSTRTTLIALGGLFAVFLILLFTGRVAATFKEIGIPVPAWMEMKGSSSSKKTAKGDVSSAEKMELLTSDLEAFASWVKEIDAAEIEVIRHAQFEIVLKSANPVHTSKLEYGIRLVQGSDRLVDGDVGKRLTLQLEGDVKGKLGKLRKDSDKEWILDVTGVSGKGKLGLSIDGMPPIFYDVELTRIWAIPVRACSDDKVYLGHAAKGLSVGERILGSGDLCGYRVLGIGINCVWFEVTYSNDELEAPLPTGIWPDFGAVDFAPPVPPESGRLIFRKGRYFWPGEAIRLPRSNYLIQIHELIRPNVAHFRLLDGGQHFLRDLVCVVVRPLP